MEELSRRREVLPVGQGISKRWSNWSNAHSCYPSSWLYPEDELQLSCIVKDSGNKRIRVVGSGHSFSPLVVTDDILISLDNMQGVIEVDYENSEVEVWAGTKLHLLNELLHKYGFSMSNLGDVDRQSVAGALCAGTHGTGLDYGVLSSFLTSVTLVDGQGEIRTFTSKDAEFPMVQINLGLLGVVTRMKLKVEPLFKLKHVVKRITLNYCLHNLKDHVTNNRHFEFFWFPYSKWVSAKFLNVTDEEIKGKSSFQLRVDDYVENKLFEQISTFAKNQPRLAPYVSKLCAQLMSADEKVNYSYKIFASNRDVKFQEMEYAIAIEDCPKVLLEIDKLIKENEIKVHFPIEVRFCKEDQITLSPCYKRTTCFIAVHMYQGMEYKKYFDLVEELMSRYMGRPHWGKMSFLKRDDFIDRYPELDKFMVFRKWMDPNNKFLNQYTEKIFGNSRME